MTIAAIESLITTAPKAAPLRSEAVDKLEAHGVMGDAAQMLTSTTACDRHVARTAIAIRSAADYVAGIMPDMRHDVNWVAHVWATLAIDAIGMGSTGGFPTDGGCTNRFPAFCACGKGRKQAADGGAWTTAIADAAQRVAQEAGCCFRWAVAIMDPGGVFPAVVNALTGERVFLADELLPSEWEAALAASQLKMYLSTGVLCRLSCNVPEEQATDIRGWGELYNSALANLRAARDTAAITDA